MNKKKENKKGKAKNKNEKYKMVSENKLKKIEFSVSLLVGICFLVLLFFAMKNEIFIPASIIAFALFLFCICYYYIEDEKKKTLVYTLFGLGVLCIIIEVVYTLIKVL